MILPLFRKSLPADTHRQPETTGLPAQNSHFISPIPGYCLSVWAVFHSEASVTLIRPLELKKSSLFISDKCEYHFRGKKKQKKNNVVKAIHWSLMEKDSWESLKQTAHCLKDRIQRMIKQKCSHLLKSKTNSSSPN